MKTRKLLTTPGKQFDQEGRKLNHVHVHVHVHVHDDDEGLLPAGAYFIF